MDRERLFKYLEQRYISKHDMLSHIPLGTQADALWQELLNRRRSKSTVLPIHNQQGSPYWFVTTEKMVAASEKIVEALIENGTEFDPYTETLTVTTLEEVFFTSFVDGSFLSMPEAMNFLQSDSPPRDAEELLIVNNRLAGAFASENLYRPIDEAYLQELARILTDGMEGGGSDYRTTDWIDIPSMVDEPYTLPPARSIPDRVGELIAMLANPQIHPLIKAGAAQAFMMAVRPFPEGNERIGRILSTVILLRAGYTFFADVSLSALIARKSYAYYGAIANTLRAENDGDLTYFMEYFLELLSRAVDERRLRLTAREEQNRASEKEMARTALTPSYVPEPSEQEEPEVFPEAQAEEPEPDALEAAPGELSAVEGGEQDRIRLGRIQDELYKSMTRTDGKMYSAACLLLNFIENGIWTFTSNDFETKIPVTMKEATNLVTSLKAKGLIENYGREGKYTTYTFSRSIEPLHDYDYAPEILARIDELASSSFSSRDKRFGTILQQCLPKGLVTEADYGNEEHSARFLPDMRLAEQLGLVERITEDTFRIQRSIKTGPPKLRKAQKEAVTEMYEIFGDDFFSKEMVIASLDYTAPHASATLHQLTLLRILDCRKEDVLWYQFLVNPVEHPECFAEPVAS